eukprot:COSAG06_NODE_7360_length_2529_cov_1.996956_2_plen_439_part_00
MIEPRRAACDAFARQLEDTGVSKKLTVLHGPAQEQMANVAGDIDLFLTSPPYFPSERYPGHDGGQVHQTVVRGEVQAYLDSFLLPVLRAQVARLSATGAMIVNIADVKNKQVCQPMLDAMAKCEDLAFAGTMLLSLSSGVLEPMYVWCRPGHRDELRRLLSANHQSPTSTTIARLATTVSGGRAAAASAAVPCPPHPSEQALGLDVVAAEEGCVCMSLNAVLDEWGLDPIGPEELRAALLKVLGDCPTLAAMKQLLGTDTLGDIHEDEACLPQVYQALQHKFGRDIVFKRGKRQQLALTPGKLGNPSCYLMLQVVLRRIEPADDLAHAGHNLAGEGVNGLYVHAFEGQSHPKFDGEWMHTIVVDPRKRTFYCHNLGGWVPIKHLALDAAVHSGTTGEGYISSVARVYVMARASKREPRTSKREPRADSTSERKKRRRL